MVILDLAGVEQGPPLPLGWYFCSPNRQSLSQASQTLKGEIRLIKVYFFIQIYKAGFLDRNVLVEGGTSIFFLLTGSFEAWDDEAFFGSGPGGGWGLKGG